MLWTIVKREIHSKYLKFQIPDGITYLFFPNCDKSLRFDQRL